MGLMGKKFKYILTYKSIDYELEFAPNGWDEDGMLGEWSRSEEFFGLIRSFSLPLRFVKDGANILRTAFIEGGVEAGVLLTVSMRKSLWDYSTIYRGGIDFSTYDYNGTEVSVNLMESGLSSDLKSKKKITYEFPVDVDDSVDMILPGIKFDDRLAWAVLPTDQSGVVSQFYTPGTDLITQSSSGFIEGFNIEQENILTITPPDYRQRRIIENLRPNAVEITISGRIKGVVRSPLSFGSSSYGNIKVGYAMEDSPDGTDIEDLFRVYGPFSLSTPKTYDVEFSKTITIQPGQMIYVTVGSSDLPISMDITEGELFINFATVSDPSPCKGFKAFNLFEKIMRRVSPAYPVNSDLINSNWNNLIFTSGSAIRELPNARIKISLDDFFSAFKGLEDAALGIDNGIMRLETGSYFARPVKTLDIGNVNTCNVTVAENLIANMVNIGYEDGNTNDNDGLEEYNSGVQYQLPITRIDNTLDWVSKVRADQYGIEQLRVTYNVKRESTSDNESDNDTFMIHCNPIDDGVYKPILGSQMDGVTGLTFPNDAYNLLLNPKLNLVRHGGYLRSILDRIDERFIEFTSGDKNTELSVTYQGKTYKINQSLPASSLDGKYFRPYIFTVNAKMPIDAMRLIDNTPFGYIEFNFNGTVCKGYIMELTVDLEGNSSQQIKLLATADSNLP